MSRSPTSFSFFFFNDTATTEIYTLSLHDALPIFGLGLGPVAGDHLGGGPVVVAGDQHVLAEDLFLDRKSTRLNSSHSQISYAVFCLKKKNNSSTFCSPSRNSCSRPRQHLLMRT